MIDLDGMIKVDSVAATLITGVGMGTNFSQFMYAKNPDLALVLKTDKERNNFVLNNPTLFASINIYSKNSNSVISSLGGLTLLDTWGESGGSQYPWVFKFHELEGSRNWELVTEEGFEIIRFQCAYPANSTFQNATGIISIDIKKTYFESFFESVNPDDANNSLLLLDETGKTILSYPKNDAYENGEFFLQNESGMQKKCIIR